MIAEAGYRYVEVARSFYAGLVDEVSAVKKAGLKVWAVHGILGEGAISPDKNVRRDTVEKAFNQAAACAEFVPCPLVEHYLCRDFDPETGKYFRDSITMFFIVSEVIPEKKIKMIFPECLWILWTMQI